jgi:hypothetical protein
MSDWGGGRRTVDKGSVNYESEYVYLGAALSALATLAGSVGDNLVKYAVSCTPDANLHGIHLTAGLSAELRG